MSDATDLKLSDPPRRRRLLTRRRVLRTLGGGLVAGIGAAAWAVAIEPHWVEVTHHSMRLGGLAHGLIGKRLVHVSDFHVGAVDVDYLARVASAVNALRPDVLAMTGDFIDHSHAGALDDLARMIGAFRPAALATVACLGNHDYGHRWRDVAQADGVAQVLNDAGVRVLRNERIDVSGLTVAGIDDLWSPHFAPSLALSGIGTTRDSLCLCHNPDACDRPEWGGFRGQILAGHTHGGQCRPPFLPPPLLPLKNRRYVAGEYDVGPGRRLFISRGIGHTLRARFNCRPEVAVFTLAAA